MNEEILSEDENIEFDEDFAYQGPVKNKYETGEVKSIQKAIQEVTRKIEQEKIKLRITDERLEGKKIQYNQLLGQPVQKTEAGGRQIRLQARRKGSTPQVRRRTSDKRAILRQRCDSCRGL